ncbi:MAG: hypothetical protein L6N95_05610 [Candidatus Methylarchaceae archaeon HK01B]|nr:hypothetical protein [Candidatus Methylarchaceae archaeon HK01B]
MSGRAQLIVADPVKGDHSIARIDKATMAYVDVKPGDEIDILGEILSGAQVRAKVYRGLIKDEGKGIIRIARDKMEEGNFKVGMKVVVYKSWIETLKLALSLKTSHKREWIEIETPELVTETTTVLTEVSKKSEKDIR